MSDNRQTDLHDLLLLRIVEKLSQRWNRQIREAEGRGFRITIHIHPTLKKAEIEWTPALDPVTIEN